MKDKLRKLLGELMSACEMIGYATSGNKRANHRATRDKAKAELLAILDAEGDGGADFPVGRFGAMRLTPKGTREFYGNLADGAIAPERGAPLYTHPARSGVVSDEDVRDAERYRYIRDNNWSADLYPVITFHKNARWDQAIDAAIQGERHER